MVRKKYKKLKIIILILIFVTIFFIIPTIVLRKSLAKWKIVTIFDKFLNEQLTEEKRIYNVFDLVRYMEGKTQSDNYNVENIENNDIIYTNSININVAIDNFDNTKQYYCNINDESYDIKEKETNVNIQLPEGKNEIKIELYENNEKIKTLNYIIYYVEPYKEQFLDELSNNGVAVHYGASEDYEQSSPLLKRLGVNYIRTDFFKYVVDPNNNNNYDYSAYDEWMKDLDNTNIKVIAIIDGTYDVDKEKNLESYVNFFNRIKERYPKIEYFEIMNEPNYRYITDERINWYAKIFKVLEESTDAKILNGGLALSPNSTGNFIDPYSFYNKFYSYDGGKYNNTINFHLYDINLIEQTINNYEQISREFGGFNRISVTEYGASTAETGEESQARTDVKDSVKFVGCNGVKILYNLWSKGEEQNWENQLGILNNDYTPKLAYYSMKNFYENTNGAEYIGQIDLGDQIEAHVYDKDGKVKIIAWTNQKSITQEIDNDNFIVSDLYGNKIDNMEDTIVVSYDPIYLDTDSDKYFFKAISKKLTKGYEELEESFSDEISKIDGYQEKIDALKEYSSQLNNISSEEETNAQNKMLEHFELGNILLQAYQNNIIEDKAKVSGMLDTLNEIGDSFEDFITVTAKTRKTNLDEINNNINEAEQILNNNSKIDILYSDKILDYAKEFRDTSEYILGISGENAIKTGLINSKAIHANELAKWSISFSNIQIQKEIESILSNIKNGIENVKSNNDWLSESTNISLKIDKINQLIDNAFSIDKTMELYNLEYDLEEKIVEEYIKGKLNCNEDNIIEVLNKLDEVSQNLKDLLKYSTSDVNINTDDIENSVNQSVDNYNKNKDSYNLNISYNLLNKAIDLYYNGLLTDDEYTNYLNSLRIQKMLNLSNDSIDKTIEINNFINGQIDKISVNYSTLDLTSASVISTINVDSNTTIKNNGGQAEYAFENNGTFDYILITNDIQYTFTVKVSNIIKPYVLKDSNILNIDKNTTVDEFISSTNGINGTIYNDSIKLQNNEKIATGCTLVYNNKEYNLIVNGDINSDGDVTVHDLISMRKVIVESKEVTLDKYEKIAADTNQSGTIDVRDLINIRKLIVK